MSALADLQQQVPVLLRQGRDEQALALVRGHITRTPDIPGLHALISTIYQHQGRLNQAIRSQKKAVSLDPEHVEYMHDLARQLIAGDKVPAARETLENITAMDDQDSDAWLNLGIVERKLGNPDKALPYFDKAVILSPTDWRPWYSKGNCHQDQGNLSESENCYRKALTLAPTGHQISIRYNLSSALADQAKTNEALAVLSGNDQPDDTDWHINRSLLLLQDGQLLQGLDLYQRRFDLPGRHARHQDIPSLATAPHDLQGQTVLLWGEQGFGDSLQFIRFAARIRDRGAKVLFQCRPPLVSLLQSQSRLIDGIWQTGMAADYQYPVMSLPLLCCQDDADLSPESPYIFPKHDGPVQVKGKHRIAVSWAGFAGHDNDLNRSMPQGEAENLLITLKDHGFDPVSIQMDATDCHLDWTRRGLVSECPGDHIQSFQETATILQSCMALVSVDTAAIHLAGAMGMAAIALLPFNPDWRWGLAEGISPWYDSVYRLRQQSPGDWKNVIDRLVPVLVGHNSRL